MDLLAVRRTGQVGHVSGGTGGVEIDDGALPDTLETAAGTTPHHAGDGTSKRSEGTDDLVRQRVQLPRRRTRSFSGVGPNPK